jgi:nucleoside permease NupC
MTEKELHPNESLHIIQAMINTAKNKLADDGFLLIFWGWLVFISAVVNYILFSLNIVYGFIVWPILMPLGGIFTTIYSNKQKKKEKVKTYVDTYLSYLWTAFGIALAVSLCSLPFYGIKSSYFCLMVVYGFVTYVSGGLLEFKALRIGALFSFACAIASIFIGEKEQLLCIAVAILCSYIIPGHLLSKTFKSQHNV